MDNRYIYIYRNPRENKAFREPYISGKFALSFKKYL